jgi:hypothetical protein
MPSTNYWRNIGYHGDAVLAKFLQQHGPVDQLVIYLKCLSNGNRTTKGTVA